MNPKPSKRQRFKSFRTLPHHFKSAQRIHSRENDAETPEA